MIAATLVALAGAAHAQPPGDEAAEEYEEPNLDPSDRELGAMVGLAIGGGNTPGGLRIEGNYLYQLSTDDWFDGGLAFTGAPASATCFRDREDELICDHGVADGAAIDLFAGVRRYLGAQQAFQPWVRPGVAARLAFFPDDDLTGVAVVAHAAAGVRARINDLIAVGGMAAVEAGGALFTRGLGAELQLGMVIGGTVEFALP